MTVEDTKITQDDTYPWNELDQAIQNDIRIQAFMNHRIFPTLRDRITAINNVHNLLQPRRRIVPTHVPAAPVVEPDPSIQTTDDDEEMNTHSSR